MNRCLYCYKELDEGNDFHKRCSLKFFGIEQPPAIDYTIDQMAELAKHVVERSVTVPGVQAKLSMTLVKETKTQSNPRLTVVGTLGGRYIFKPPVDSYPEMPANEHVTMRMAEIFGIRTVPSSLIRLASGELSYITKRVDRSPEGEKTHMIDMFQTLEAFDKYIGSYERIGKAIGRYSENPLLDKLFFFEMVLFSFLTCNSDMHLKNFSMIQSKSGWILSPAYDLLNVSIILPEDEEDLALTITGKRKKLNRDHFQVFGEGMQLTKKQIDGVFSRFQNFKSQAEGLISESFLSERMREQYLATIENRFVRIF